MKVKFLGKRKRIVHVARFVKAVSTVVAVLLMIAIAVIASLVAYFWVTGYFKTTSTKISKAIQIENAYYTGQYLGVYVENIGQGKATLIANQCLYVDGALRTSANVNPGKLQETSYMLQESDIALVVDAISLNLGQTIKIKIVTSEGTFVEYSFTINTFQGQNPYSLALFANPPAGGSVAADNNGPYSYGDVVQLTANPAAGWSFSGWSGDASGSTNPTSIVINGTNTVTATFTQNEYALTLDIVGGGSVSKLPDKATYHSGDSVQLQANAASGWTFSGWSGDLTGVTNPSSVVIDETPEVTATFTQNQYTLTVNVDPLGSGSVSRNNTGPYSYGDVVELTANPTAGWSFSAWSQDLTGSVNPATILIDGDKTVTATFTPNTYTLTISTVGQGDVSRNNTGPYSYGDVVELTANPTASWSFSAWSQDLTGSVNPATILIDGDKTVTATFTQNEFTLILNVVGSGSVSKVPDQATYHSGDSVQLQANAASGWTFSGWSGDLTGTTNPDSVIIDETPEVTATFVQSEYSIGVTVLPSIAAGSVTPNLLPPYHYGDVVTLSESPNPGYTFSGWSGAGVDGAGNTRVVTVTGNMAVTLTFTQNEYMISVTVDPSPAAGTVTPDVAGPYHYGDVVTLTESASPGYTFSGWSGDGSGSGTTRTVTVTGDMAVTATFIQNSYSLTMYTVGQGSVTPGNGTGYHYGDVVQLTATANIGWGFQGWSSPPGGSTSPASITISDNTVVTATFIQTAYTLTVNVVGSGSVTKSPNLSLYTPGTVVNLTAVPVNGYRLSAWSGDLTGSTNPTSITMNGDKTVTATFVAGTPTTIGWNTWPSSITLGSNWNGIGVLSGGGTGLSNRQLILTFTRPDGTKIVTTTTTFWLLVNGVFYATTTPDMVGQWSITVQFLGDATYGAYTTTPITFQVVPSPQYAVSFRQTGAGVAPTVTYHIGSGSDQQGTVPFDVMVDEDSAIYYTYQATVPGASGIQYVLTGTSPSSPETITSAETITGTYKTQYYVTFAVNPSGSGTINRATGWFDSGSLSITATANSGHAFALWSSDTPSITFANSGSSSTTATINGPGTITASFISAVTFVSAGTGSGTTSNPTPAYPTSLQANDLILLQVTVRDTSNTPTTPSGFTLLYGPDSTGTGRQWIYYKFATGTESGTITVTISGSSCKIARMYAFRNVAPSSFTEGGSFGSGTGSTISARSVTTTGSGRLAVSFVFINNDNSVSSFTGETGGDWTEAVSEYTTSAGSNGCVQLQTATMVNAGTISGGTTSSGGDPWGVRAFALIPSP